MRTGRISPLGACRVAERHRLLPLLADYEAWLADHQAANAKGCRRDAPLTARSYRRIVQLRDLGDDWTAIARAVGVRSGAVCRRAWSRLPDCLRQVR